MDNAARIEQCLEDVVKRASQQHCAPKLAKAVQYALFPGGARLRPQLTLAVAAACGEDDVELSDAAGAAVEMMHCASLVHDDLPCFDDADIRRGKPSVHTVYGEEIAVLVGDALIVQAYQTICEASSSHPDRLAGLITCITDAIGMRGGIIAGQAWESEDVIDVQKYHCAKTGSLFVGAVSAGALAAGSDPQPWRSLGLKIGEAYQLADDLLDAMGSTEESGKPVGQDIAHGRPSAVQSFGFQGTVDRLNTTVKEAVAAIPDCDGSKNLRELIAGQAKRLVPSKLATQAA